MMPFREWLKLQHFYEIELKEIEERILIAEATINSSVDLHIEPLFEALIEPHKIKITTNNIEKLNKEFVKYNIVFEHSPNEIRAFYKPENDVILIIFKKDTKFNVIEALIGHEMVHREQHRRSGGNYFKQAEKIVGDLNSLKDKINALDNSIPEQAKEFQKLYKQYNELKNTFLFLTPYESMAYAYQFVKEYKNLLPYEILEKLKEDNIKINNVTKKYVAMYWLIRDKI